MMPGVNWLLFKWTAPMTERLSLADRISYAVTGRMRNCLPRSAIS